MRLLLCAAAANPIQPKRLENVVALFIENAGSVGEVAPPFDGFYDLHQPRASSAGGAACFRQCRCCGVRIRCRPLPSSASRTDIDTEEM